MRNGDPAETQDRITFADFDYQAVNDNGGARRSRWIVLALAAAVLIAALVWSVASAQAQTCGDMSTCEEAVILWCEGYGRADGDGDGIPCETVCCTKERVDEIRDEVGC